MGTIAEKLEYLLETKDLIRQAIEAQGVDVPEGTPFREYPDLILTIEGSGSGGEDSGGGSSSGGSSSGDSDDGLVDYNGVKLPDISSYMNSTYKDAAIVNSGSTYYLYVIGGDWELEETDDTITTSVGSIHKAYSVQEGGTAWTYQSADSSTEYVGITLKSSLYTPIYTTFDLSGDDSGSGSGGTSEEEQTPIAYLYNGVQLPALPEWDREAYPYAVIVKGLVPYYNRLFIGSELSYTTTTVGYTYVIGNIHKAYYEKFYKTSYGEWKEYSAFSAGNDVAVNDQCSDPGYTIWTNTDLYLEDGTVNILASEPIPVYE